MYRSRSYVREHTSEAERIGICRIPEREIGIDDTRQKSRNDKQMEQRVLGKRLLFQAVVMTSGAVSFGQNISFRIAL